MQIGMIGLGKMGLNLARNMVNHGHDVAAYDIDKENVAKAERNGVRGADSIADLTKRLSKPRTVWLMVPAGAIVDEVLQELAPCLEPEDRVLDGGNSHYRDTLRRGEQLKAKGIHYFDVGTSGGVEGALTGACTMIGGNEAVFQELEPLFRDISTENGYLYTGRLGSGHFLKMVHNGIEYGMMQAIAEGFELLNKSEFDYHYGKVAKVWNHGSVIRSWLMELMENAFSKDPDLEGIRGIMHSSGEGKWTVETALDYKVPTPVIALSLMMRYRSLEEDTFTGRVVAALRNEFGGHEVVRK